MENNIQHLKNTLKQFIQKINQCLVWIQKVWIQNPNETQKRIITGSIVLIIATIAIFIKGIALCALIVISVSFMIEEGIYIINKTPYGTFWSRIFIISYFIILSYMFYSLVSTNQTMCIMLILIISATDIGCYFVGRYFGKTKLIPSISPNKSLEGLLGGIVSGMLISQIFAIFLNLSSIGIFAISITTSILAQGGDFTESYFKRLAQLKDSGKILPGHGGVLDRIDGYLFCIPFFFFIAKLFFQ